MSKSKDAKVPAPADQVDHELEGLMSEIESGLREDELKKLWTRYGGFIVMGAVAVVLGVAGFQFWRTQEEKAHIAMAARYDAALAAFDAGNFDAATKDFAAIAADKGEGYAALARLQEAAAKLQLKDTPGAIAAYKALADDPRADPIFRDLGTVLMVQHALDTADPKSLDKALTPLLVPTNSYYFSALELASLVAAKQGDTARAAELAERIVSDPAAPVGARSRAQDLAALFKPAATPTTPVAPSPPPAQGQR